MRPYLLGGSRVQWHCRVAHPEAAAGSPAWNECDHSTLRMLTWRKMVTSGTKTNCRVL